MELPEVITLCGEEYIKRSAVEALREGTAPVRGEPERVLTAAQVSEMSGIAIRTVYSLMDRGVLPYKVPNGCKRPRLVKMSDYESLVGLR